jgi:hypothetical protein
MTEEHMPTHLSGRSAATGLMLLAAACSDAHQPDTVAPVHTTILFADAPFPSALVRGASLYILDVRLGTTTGPADSPCRETEIVVAPYRAFNLLELQRGATATLGEADLPPGEYRTVCLTFEPQRSYLWLVGQAQARVDWGSAGYRMLQAELLTPIVVEGAGTTIVIHLDLGASFVPLPLDGPPTLDSGFVFRPALSAVDPARTGSLAGRVVVGPTDSPIAQAAVRLSVGAPGSPAGTRRVVATGLTDAAGTFRLPFLAPSEHWAAGGQGYVLDVDPPEGGPFAAARREAVEIVAGRETLLEDVVLAPTVDLRENRIAFVVDGTNVASVREDGANRALLTAYPSGAYERTEIAAWSADGTELLGKRIEVTPLDEKIVAIAGDGSGIRVLARGLGAWGIYPGTWAPDGSRLAYVLAHAAHGDQLRIHTVARDGSGDAVLDTGRDPLDRVSDYSPAWSPDGGQIAFLTLRVEATGYRTFAFIVADEGGAPRLQIAEEPAMEALAWSPEGERLAVLAGRSGVGEILVVNRDGSGLARLSPGKQDGMPVWSPDGARLAFTSLRDGNQELYVMNADGSGVRRLTDHPGLDQAPVWSPDGARLAFQSDRDGNWEIYTIGADGSGLTNLTKSPAEETQPKWR